MILTKYLEELYEWYQHIYVDKGWANIPIITNIEKNLGLTFIPASFDSAQGSTGNVCMAGSFEVRDAYKDSFTPINLLNYIYAVLHTSSYRKKYDWGQNIDFSRVPYPKDFQCFWNLVDLGDQLRQLQQSESPRIEAYIAAYQIDGDNIVKYKPPISSPGLEPGDLPA